MERCVVRELEAQLRGAALRAALSKVLYAAVSALPPLQKGVVQRSCISQDALEFLDIRIMFTLSIAALHSRPCLVCLHQI